MNKIEVRFKQLVAEICQENDWILVAREVMPDHCHLFLNCLPADSPSEVMARVKGVTFLDDGDKNSNSCLICEAFGHVLFLLAQQAMYPVTRLSVMLKHRRQGGEYMPTITLRLELHKPTGAKQQMYHRRTEINTNFANWLLLHPGVHKATSTIFKEFSGESFPSAIVNQTIREVKSQKKKAKAFRKIWCCFNNQNFLSHA